MSKWLRSYQGDEFRKLSTLIFNIRSFGELVIICLITLYCLLCSIIPTSLHYLQSKYYRCTNTPKFSYDCWGFKLRYSSFCFNHITQWAISSLQGPIMSLFPVASIVLFGIHENDGPLCSLRSSNLILFLMSQHKTSTQSNFWISID